MLKNKGIFVVCAGVLMMMGWSISARAQSPSIHVDYYSPQFYVDTLVFYDEAGTPIYYDDDTAYSVPEDYENYDALVEHFRQNTDAYYRWFEELGYSNLNYRKPVASSYYEPEYYFDQPVFYDEAGIPTYYVDGVVHRVPSSYELYNSLIQHYRHKQGAYRRWYRENGRHLRWYRRPIGTNYYDPLYYDGYVVYFDVSGLPYYYLGGRIVYVPNTYHLFHTYVSHYRKHRTNYQRWHKMEGNRYHGYRRSASPRRRVVNTRAPRSAHGRAVNRSYRRQMAPDMPPPPPGMRPPRGTRVHHVAPPPPPARQRSRVIHSGRPPAPQKRNEMRQRVQERRIDCRTNPGHPACGGGHAKPREQRRKEHRGDRGNNPGGGGKARRHR
ncbi:MAG: hypothetical protein V1754_03495 [Pseudomonadota bacterium]